MSKKLIIAALIAVSIILAAVVGPVPVCANNGPTISRAAVVCRDIGVLRGGINGVDEAYLSSFATRLQAMHITARLMGRENAAVSYAWTSNFNDAHLVDYEGGRNLLAYVKANPVLGWQGDQQGNVNPLGYMTAQAMYKVLLSVLGYVPEADFDWDATLAFAHKLGLRALAPKRGYLTNNDISFMLVEALKTRMKNSEDTLCEYLTGIGVIRESAAYTANMLPGSPGFAPLLSYRKGGPLLVAVLLAEEQKKVSIRFNTELNPTYAKALKNYNYYMPGTGYIPLPGKCQTSMLDEYTVVIQFPGEGWLSYSERVESDAFLAYIATERKNELRVSGLYDVDGAPLRDVLIDVPPPSR
ncbi:MAG: hypothetical protein FWH01_02390 [Oscillospiraceae bacterium]|nr:hypothetical protein [Oscillospiraceae bacterium]